MMPCKAVRSAVLTLALTVFPSVGAAETHYSLSDCVNRALSANRDLATVRDRVSGSQFNLDSAQSEFDWKFKPLGSVDIAGNPDEDIQEGFAAGMGVEKSMSFGTEIAVTPQINRIRVEDDDLYESVVGLSIDQPLLRGLGKAATLSNVYNANYQLRTARRNHYLAQVSIALEVVRRVYTLLQLQRQIEIIYQSVRRLKMASASASIKRRVGIADAEDVFRAEERLKQSQSELVASQKSLQRQFDGLRTLMRLTPDAVFGVSAPNLELKQVPTEKEVRAIALDNRMEIEQAKDDIREELRQSRLAKHNILPELNVVFSYQQSDRANAIGSAWPFDNPGAWTLSLVSDTDVSRKVEKINYQQSLLDVQNARRALESTREAIANEVKDALRNMLENKETMDLQSVRIESARKQVALSRLKFNHGLTNNFDLIDAEQVLKTAQIQHLAAVTEYIIATYSLQRSIGTLFEERIQKPDAIDLDE